MSTDVESFHLTWFIIIKYNNDDAIENWLNKAL